MKKITYILVALLAIVAFSACSDDSTSTNHPAKYSTTSKSSSERADSSSSTQEGSSSVQSEPSQTVPQISDEEQPSQEQDRIVYVARDGTADVYWYSMDNMPANTNKSRVVQMKESDAIAAGKRHTTKEY
ncbi:deoxyribonuclease [Streptococcus criceti]|uniref:Lipoprotein n=1 Tax=Streptococcus criceti HS-6 TaxID=873449 RepID=G5JNN0_STRCG|nr:hypothetical protein [Streptococcus criceti]EHI73938.1 putative lipoprotein [Streptococcus criceti HS-6]SUN41694.1 deoxyribonuclease [Streptococcus criceti]